jgi:hypothetical protein
MRENTYEMLIVVRSREGKAIDEHTRSKIMLFLLAHKVVRIVQHVNKLETAVILSTVILDDEKKALMRLLLPVAIIHPDVGMPAYDGVESLRAFYDTPRDFFDMMEKIAGEGYTLAKFRDKGRTIKEWDLADPIAWPDAIVDDPYYLLNVLLPEHLLTKAKKKKLRELIKAGRRKFGELLDFIEKHAHWIYPVIKKIIESVQKRYIYIQ